MILSFFLHLLGIGAWAVAVGAFPWPFSPRRAILAFFYGAVLLLIALTIGALPK